MTAELLWSNLRMYSLQIALLIGVAAAVPAVLRLRMPRAKLLYWHIVLVACLALPLLRPPQRAVMSGSVEITTTVIDSRPAAAARPWRISPIQAILAVLVIGFVLRLGWLAIGLWKLRHHRQRSRALPGAVPDHLDVDVRLSNAVSSPVTFGVRKPVVLLPEHFPDLDSFMQRAILCHELLHIARRDWLFTVVEEVIRAVFWFHPAIWWLLGEIGLAREQEVDRQVVARTQAPESYVDALLAIAGVAPQLDLAPAPLFLRKRHLKQRVVSILKEAAMSKTRWISALAAGLGVVAAACWLITATFPLTAAPQVVNDGTGVSVDVGGATLMHRAPVMYPRSALVKGVQGTVVVQVRLDSTGTVVDAQVLSGPDELRKAALESVLQWHFTRDASGATRQVSINFQAPATGAPASAATVAAPPYPLTPAASAPTSEPPTLKEINIHGLSEQERNELSSHLPVRIGDVLTRDSLQKLLAEVKQFDEHLTVGVRNSKTDKTATLVITAPGASSITVQQTLPPPGSIKIDGVVQQAKIIEQVRPVYPPEAKAAHIQGKVSLEAVIGMDGSVLSLKALPGGHPLLIPAAIDAVKQWKYQPTLLNGEPIEVVTTIDINFTLME